jgi:hypothetical protein
MSFGRCVTGCTSIENLRRVRALLRVERTALDATMVSVCLDEFECLTPSFVMRRRFSICGLVGFSSDVGHASGKMCTKNAYVQPRYSKKVKACLSVV